MTTWNVRADTPPGERSAAALDEHIANVLNRIHTDVVMLQNVASRQQAQAVADRLIGTWTYGAVPDVR